MLRPCLGNPRPVRRARRHLVVGVNAPFKEVVAVARRREVRAAGLADPPRAASGAAIEAALAARALTVVVVARDRRHGPAIGHEALAPVARRRATRAGIPEPTVRLGRAAGPRGPAHPRRRRQCPGAGAAPNRGRRGSAATEQGHPGVGMAARAGRTGGRARPDPEPARLRQGDFGPPPCLLVSAGRGGGAWPDTEPVRWWQVRTGRDPVVDLTNATTTVARQSRVGHVSSPSVSNSSRQRDPPRRAHSEPRAFAREGLPPSPSSCRRTSSPSWRRGRARTGVGSGPG